MILGISLFLAGCLVGACIWAWRVRAICDVVVKASRRMRRRYRARMVAMELGWRKRDERREEVVNATMGKLLGRVATIQPYAIPHGNTRMLGVNVSLDEREMCQMIQPNDGRDYIRFVCQRLGMQVESAMRDINFSRVHELREHGCPVPWNAELVR